MIAAFKAWRAKRKAAREAMRCPICHGFHDIGIGGDMGWYICALVATDRARAHLQALQDAVPLKTLYDKGGAA